MKLLFKQKISWFVDKYDIFNEQGDVVFYVRGKFAIKHKLEIYDINWNCLGLINEEFLTITPRFTIYLGDSPIGEIRKRFTFFKPIYDLDCMGWHVEGNLLGWDYKVYDRTNQIIMRAHKEVFNWTDTYTIDIPDDKNTLLCLMIVLAIDAANCSEKK